MAWTAIYVHKVDDGTEITVTMSFANLESNSAASDTDYIFRADVRNADCCEGGGMGNDRYMYQVDEDPEVRTGSISVSCAPGGYTVKVSISSRQRENGGGRRRPHGHRPGATTAGTDLHRRHAER